MSQLADQLASPKPLLAYSSGHGRARVVLGLFATLLLVAIGMLIAEFYEFKLLGDISRKLPVDRRQLQFDLHWVFGLSIAWMVLYVATAIAFLTWIYRAHQNLPALGARNLEFSPRGAVGWYFFPLMNLFKPYQAMRELHANSVPTLQNEEPTKSELYPPPLVKCWWFFFLLMGFAGRLTSVGTGDDAASLQIAAGACIVFDVLAIIAILLAAALVRSIDIKQSARSVTIAIG